MSFKKAYFLSVLLIPSLFADNFNYNTYNNHGVLGLINIPSARFYNEGDFGITAYIGTPDQKISFTSSPYDWLEASFFYTNIQDKPYCGNKFDPVCKQDYKDKGFNFKARIKKEGIFPAIAVGINDIAGTGLYGSEYVVGSYGIGSLDIHFGLGWGTLNGTKDFKNPLIYLDDRFSSRPNDIGCSRCENKGGQFEISRYFSDESVSPFFGIAYAINEKIIVKIERDTTLVTGEINYEIPSRRLSYGIDYSPSKNFTIGVSQERGNFLSLRFIYKNNSSSNNKFAYEKSKRNVNDNNYSFLIKNLESNGIGVNKIVESADSIGLEITQFSLPNLDIVEDILYSSVADSGITKDVKTTYKIADLEAFSNFNEDYKLQDPFNVIYKREKTRNLNTNTRFSIRPYIAGREGFLKLALLIENNTEYVIKDNFFFSSNLKYGIWDNFDDLTVPPVNTYPAQVRSDVKDYLRNIDHPIIGRAQFDYHLTPIKNNHLMLTAGILEEMFSGFGFEYLYFNNKKSYAFGFEAFNVKKRDYEMRFGTLDYKTITGSANFYFRNYKIIPFDAKISYGKYLAGDKGTTFELSRSYANGTKFGVFATFTDVSYEQFGEGSFDKGIFFSIPVYKDMLSYTWRPLTKDPGATLNRKSNLYNLLVKFKSYNF